MLKISAFYLDKQKSFIPKKKFEVYHVPWIALISAKRWRLDVLTFLIHGFEYVHTYTVEFVHKMVKQPHKGEYDERGK